MAYCGAGMTRPDRSDFRQEAVYTKIVPCTYRDAYAEEIRDRVQTPAHVDEPKVAMSYRLSPAKIARAQRILGTRTATSTIEEALDLVVFRRELVDGLDQAFGAGIVEAFPPSNRRRKRS